MSTPPVGVGVVVDGDRATSLVFTFTAAHNLRAKVLTALEINLHASPYAECEPTITLKGDIAHVLFGRPTQDFEAVCALAANTASAVGFTMTLMPATDLFASVMVILESATVAGLSFSFRLTPHLLRPGVTALKKAINRRPSLLPQDARAKVSVRNSDVIALLGRPTTDFEDMANLVGEVAAELRIKLAPQTMQGNEVLEMMRLTITTPLNDA